MASSGKFPLYLHGSGQWAKKINAKTHYFGKDKDMALVRYKSLLSSGLIPKRSETDDGVPFEWNGLNHFLNTWRSSRIHRQKFFQNYVEYVASREFLFLRGMTGSVNDAVDWYDFVSRQSTVMRKTGVYAYLVVAGRYMKIGASRRPLGRLVEISIGCPELPTLKAILPGGFEHEKRLHEMFAEFRTRPKCEWFHVTDYVAEFLGEVTRIEQISTDSVYMLSIRDPKSELRRQMLERKITTSWR